MSLWERLQSRFPEKSRLKLLPQKSNEQESTMPQGLIWFPLATLAVTVLLIIFFRQKKQK